MAKLGRFQKLHYILGLIKTVFVFLTKPFSNILNKPGNLQLAVIRTLMAFFREICCRTKFRLNVSGHDGKTLATSPAIMLAHGPCSLLAEWVGFIVVQTECLNVISACSMALSG